MKLDFDTTKRLVEKYESKLTSHAVEHKKAMLWALIAEVTDELNRQQAEPITEGDAP